MKAVSDLSIRIFADGADKAGIVEMAESPLIAGFTTNPSLMRQAGVAEYERFAREILDLVPDRPISFEVLADDFDEMESQALSISSWGENVYVKIPITNCRRESCGELLRRLAAANVKVNVTALMTLAQVYEAAECLSESSGAFISLFAGRIADTGRDPVPMVAHAVRVLAKWPQLELIWASPRELLNIFQADAVGCHVITVTSDVLKKLSLVGKDLSDFSLETVQMFHHDAVAAGYRIPVRAPQTAERKRS